MLVLDFINVGNGDSILVREMEGERLRFSMLVDCGHDSLERDDHPPVEDPRSCRIFAGDFLRSQGVAHLDILLVTHFHRDHIGVQAPPWWWTTSRIEVSPFSSRATSLVSVTTRPSKRTSLESVFSKCAASIVLCLSFPALCSA